MKLHIPIAMRLAITSVSVIVGAMLAYRVLQLKVQSEIKPNPSTGIPYRKRSKMLHLSHIDWG
jgi:hypothetical protein